MSGLINRKRIRTGEHEKTWEMIRKIERTRKDDWRLAKFG